MKVSMKKHRCYDELRIRVDKSRSKRSSYISLRADSGTHNGTTVGQVALPFHLSIDDAIRPGLTG